MTERNRDTYDERRLQIMDGALRVFSKQGFRDATNRDIATEAGIASPGLIYHYFKDKEDLLRAVIERFGPPMRLVLDADAFMALPPEEALTQFAQAYVRLAEDTTVGACLRLLFREAMRDPAFAAIIARIGPMRVWGLLAEYLQRQMDAGTLRQADPVVATRCFVGPLVLHLLIHGIVRIPDAANVSADDLVSTTVDMFLRGFRPDAEPN
jgi:AcrR family transcriptional regulator